MAGFLYYDARADDARLTLTVLRTAVDGYGAAAANYAEVVGFLRDGAARVTGAKVRDLGDPDAPAFEIRARVVVNATGVWTDDVLALDEADPTSSLRPAKGVHVTVPASRFPADIAAVIPVRGDHRSIFVVPVARGGPRLPGHHRHRLRGRPRRPPVHRRGRRLPAGRGQRRQQRRAHPRRRDRGVGRAATAAQARAAVIGSPERTADLSRRAQGLALR